MTVGKTVAEIVHSEVEKLCVTDGIGRDDLEARLLVAAASWESAAQLVTMLLEERRRLQALLVAAEGRERDVLKRLAVHTSSLD